MALLSIAVLIILLFRSGNDGAKIFGAIAFCTSMFILYANSCLYHSVTNQNAKTKVFRRLDHCSIYLLIVGTYSVVLLTLPGMEREWFPGSLSVGISLLILQ
jgi:hemolysin III